MFGIGAFARLGQVSLRTLRYYDQEGLLTPASVDEHTGYRWYRAEQLHRLNRILALRDLGLSLSEIRQVLDDELTAGELRGMLRLRQLEARQRLDAEEARLARAEARLRRVESEGQFGGYDVVVKAVAPLRVAFVSEDVAAFGDDNLGPTFARLFPKLALSLSAAGLAVVGPAVALYGESGDDRAPIRAFAALPVGPGASEAEGFEVCDLPGVRRAATTIHKGAMSRVDEGYEALAIWAEDAGERLEEYGRELYLECDGDPEAWVTELLFPLIEPNRSEDR